MVTINCKHVSSGMPAVSKVTVKVLDPAPPTVQARRQWIEAEAQLCSICTAGTRAALDGTVA